MARIPGSPQLDRRTPTWPSAHRNTHTPPVCTASAITHRKRALLFRRLHSAQADPPRHRMPKGVCAASSAVQEDSICWASRTTGGYSSAGPLSKHSFRNKQCSGTVTTTLLGQMSAVSDATTCIITSPRSLCPSVKGGNLQLST